MQRKVLEQKVGIENIRGERKAMSDVSLGEKYCVQLKAGTPNDRKS